MTDMQIFWLAVGCVAIPAVLLGLYIVGCLLMSLRGLDPENWE